MAYPIVDSHVHLYTRDHLKDLAWAGELPHDHVLNTENSIKEYSEASHSAENFAGFIFIETDRKSGLEEADWKWALEEIAFVAQVKGGKSGGMDGDLGWKTRRLLGMVPWIPILAEEDMIRKYVQQAREAVQSRCDVSLMKGFRYLAQDKPRGTLLDPSFVRGLITLEELGLGTFDLGIDTRQGGLWQLDEAEKMLDQFYAGAGRRLKIIINHLCKPNLRLTPEDINDNTEDFTKWKGSIQRLALFPTTYMKLSGLFSELPPQNSNQPASILVCLRIAKPWLDVVFDAFGPARIMFGSDWPVCNVGGPGRERSWQHWHDFVTALMDQQQLTDQDKVRVWSDTAIEAYGLKDR